MRLSPATADINIPTITFDFAGSDNGRNIHYDLYGKLR